jgi:hypothetical protein
MSKILAGAFAFALVAAGSARAMDQWSFTDQVQVHQGIAQARAARGEREYTASEPVAPTETGSFTDRVAGWHGLKLGGEPSEALAASDASKELEASSFTSRVQAFQGIGQTGSEGAAAGEPRTR